MKKRKAVLPALLFWLALWAVLSLLIDQPLLLPGPIAVLRRLAALLVTAPFWRTVSVTLLRILAGMAAGTLFGAILAVLTCRFRWLELLFSPLLTVIKSTPVASFIVLAVIWIGRDLLPSVIVVLMVLPVVWANVSAGIRGTDPLLVEMAQVYGFSPSRRLKRIYIPSVLPHFYAALKSALGLAWKSGVAAEVLTVPGISIGKMLMESKLYMETTELFAWTLVVILCSLGIEKLLLGGISLLISERKETQKS